MKRRTFERLIGFAFMLGAAVVITVLTFFVIWILRHVQVSWV